ncbi:MAG TPA: hypothetical protein ENK85_09910 [Saprospiraceae bacterium]|nr:hypothetical protein [Saprospiraceae bacterium]
MSIVSCPNCKKIIKEYSVSSNQVTCPSCTHSFSIEKSLNSHLSKEHKKPGFVKGVDIHKSRQSLVIDLNWKLLTNWRFTLIFGILLTLFNQCLAIAIIGDGPFLLCCFLAYFYF